MKLQILCFLFLTPLVLSEDEDCSDPSLIGNRTCVRLERCPHAQFNLKRHWFPVTCGFQGKEPLVCCPAEDVLKTATEVAYRVCAIYNQPFNAMFNGREARPKEFPHIAALGFLKGTQKSWVCGGTLISRWFILTAAHCTKSREFGQLKWVRLNELDFDQDNESSHEDFDVDKIHVHPLYKFKSHYHDIALIRVARRIDKTKPACLHIDGPIPDKLEILGWGQTDVLSPQSNKLLKAALNLLPSEVCKMRFRPFNKKLAHGIDTERQICAGHPSGTDACRGDSGGPLLYHRDIYNKSDPSTFDVYPHFVVAGVTSFGKGCGVADSCGVYTRVSAYMPWLVEIVWPHGNYIDEIW